MTKREIRKKAIECKKLRIDHCNSHRIKHLAKPCTSCEYYDFHAECSVIFAYEHGFADGVEEGKRQASKYGHWVDRGFTGRDWNRAYQCSECGYTGESYDAFEYCPDCGAKMTS